MKVLSYNICGVREIKNSMPNFNIRKANIERILGNLLKNNGVKVCCFQYERSII